MPPDGFSSPSTPPGGVGEVPDPDRTNESFGPDRQTALSGSGRSAASVHRPDANVVHVHAGLLEDRRVGCVVPGHATDPGAQADVVGRVGTEARVEQLLAVLAQHLVEAGVVDVERDS